MTWQLASFALLACALAAGFGWYERARPPARLVALVATLAALGALGRVAFGALPNVKPLTDIAIISGFALGAGPGFAVGALGEACGVEHRGRRVVADAVAQEVVAGVLQEQRHRSRQLHAPARGREEALGHAQERRLPRAVASHQRDALSGCHDQVDRAQGRRAAGELLPDPAQAQRRRRAALPAARASLRCGSRGALSPLEQPMRTQRGPRRFDVGG